MKDDAKTSSPSAARVAGTDVRRLARQAIGVLAANTERGGARQRDRLVALSNACVSPDSEHRHDAFAMLRASGVSVEDMVDHLIPETARMLGERWFADEISFADVTIGTARLQEAVHALDSRTGFHSRTTPKVQSSKRILLILPRGEDHSLGIFVFADQLRRRGYLVDVAVDQHPHQIGKLVRQQRFAMVGISASGRRTLASAKDIVEKIRTMATHILPVVVRRLDGMEDKTLLDLSGADHVADGAKTALNACGLSVSLVTQVDEGQVGSRGERAVEGSDDI